MEYVDNTSIVQKVQLVKGEFTFFHNKEEVKVQVKCMLENSCFGIVIGEINCQTNFGLLYEPKECREMEKMILKRWNLNEDAEFKWNSN